MRKMAALLYLCVLLLLTACAPASPDTMSQEKPIDFGQPAAGNAGVEAAGDTGETAYENIVNANQTYSYEMLVSDSKKLAAMYPGLVEVGSAGTSVEGRDLVLIKLGKGKTKLVLAGAHHAREYITATFLMETVDEYARAYATTGTLGGMDIRALLDAVTVYIVPMVNPDGVNLVQNGPDAAQNPAAVKAMRMLKSSYSEWKANINGVDLNRQYPCHWEEKASNTDVPSSEMYKGAAPATEPEVQAMMRLCQENDFALAASFHSKGEVIYWADSGTDAAIEAGASIAQTLSDVTGYDLMDVSEDPAVYGAGFENWFRQEYVRPAFCVELTPVGDGSLPHDDTRFDELVWQKAKGLIVALMQSAIE